MPATLSVPPFSTARSIDFDATESLAALRQMGSEMAVLAGLSPERVHALELAISELATNSLQHGGGHGHMDIWVDDGAVVCVVSDAGSVEPLAGRQRPEPSTSRGRGLWLVNRVCDEVERRISVRGTATRVVVRG